MELIWQMEIMEILLDGYFHFHCYIEGDKIKQEITKSVWHKGGNYLGGICVKMIHQVHLGGAVDR